MIFFQDYFRMVLKQTKLSNLPYQGKETLQSNLDLQEFYHHV